MVDLGKILVKKGKLIVVYEDVALDERLTT